MGSTIGDEYPKFPQVAASALCQQQGVASRPAGSVQSTRRRRIYTRGRDADIGPDEDRGHFVGGTTAIIVEVDGGIA